MKAVRLTEIFTGIWTGFLFLALMVTVIALLTGCGAAMNVTTIPESPFPDSKRVALVTITYETMTLPVSKTLGPITPVDGWHLVAKAGTFDIDNDGEADHIIVVLEKGEYQVILVGRFSDNESVFYAIYRGEELIEWAGNDAVAKRAQQA